MAPTNPEPTCSAAFCACEERSDVMQVSDSSEPLVSYSSSGPQCVQMTCLIPNLPVQVLDSYEPLVLVTSESQVKDPNEPLVLQVPNSLVQALDSCDPLAPVTSLSLQTPVPEGSPTRLSAAQVLPSTSTVKAEFAASLSLTPLTSIARPSTSQVVQPGSYGRRTNLYVEELKSQWNLRRVFRELGTHEDCVQFAIARKLLPSSKMCTYHKRPMSVSKSHGQLGLFRCYKSKCRKKQVPRAEGTWFENVHLALNLVFQIMYMFSQGYTYKQVQRETSDDRVTVLSMKTIANWFIYCREVIIIYELDHQIYENKIGGPKKVVQIDVLKLGKRKLNRGRHLEDLWILVMIEDGSFNLRMEVCPNNVRTAEVLVPLIKKHVAERSIVHTDNCRVYDWLPEEGYIYIKVDPENKLVVPDETHTKITGNHLRGSKRLFQKNRHKENFLECLAVLSWRRKNRIYHRDSFEELLKAVTYVYK